MHETGFSSAAPGLRRRRLLTGAVMTALAGRAFGRACVDMAEGTLVGFRRGRSRVALLAAAIFGHHRRRRRRRIRGGGRRGAVVVRRLAGGERKDEQEWCCDPAEPDEVRS